MTKNKVWKLLGNIIFYAVLITLIAISGFSLNSVRKGVQPSFFGYKFFTVLTGSMSPTININDLVIVKEVKPEKIEVNDIITFGSTNSDNITTHRVKEIINENNAIKYVTQGDANNVEDPSPVQSDALIGKVVKFVPKVGAVMAWMKNNLTKIIVFVVALMALFVIGAGLRKRLKFIDEEEKNKNFNEV